MELKRIKNLKQYTNYCDLYESLLVKGLKKDIDKIDLLELLIEDFDRKTINELGNSTEMNPVELLTYLLDEHQLTKAQLSRELNVSRQLITEIVNYKRNISKKMAMSLSNYFNIRPAAFAQPYELKGKKKSAA